MTSRGRPGTMGRDARPDTASVAAAPHAQRSLHLNPDVLCPPFAQWLASSLQSLNILRLQSILQRPLPPTYQSLQLSTEHRQLRLYVLG